MAELGFAESVRAIRGPVDSTVELEVRSVGAPHPRRVVATRKRLTT